MATVSIPSLPAGTTTTITLTTSATDLTPNFGGPAQRLARMGDKWTYQVECRKMMTSQGAQLAALLTQGLTAKLVCPVVVCGLDTSKYSDDGAVVGAATGSTLTHSGGGATKVAGQFFSLVDANNTRYLHQITAVNGDSLTFIPPLKAVVSGGEQLEFATPKIEGFIDGNSQNWTIGLAVNVGLTFKITESQ